MCDESAGTPTRYSYSIIQDLSKWMVQNDKKVPHFFLRKYRLGIAENSSENLSALNALKIDILYREFTPVATRGSNPGQKGFHCDFLGTVPVVAYLPIR